MGEDLSRERPKKGNKKMRLRGIEPPHAAPEATALSTELQTHLHYDTIFFLKLQVLILHFYPFLLSYQFKHRIHQKHGQGNGAR